MANDGYPIKTLYPFAEGFLAQTDGTTDKTIWAIPAYTIITGVLVRVVTAGSGSTTNYATVGDEDDPDGFIAGFDPNSTAGTIIGDTGAELGAYLYDATEKKDRVKHYAAAKNMVVDCEVTTNTTNPIFEVWVFGYRYYPSS